LNHNFSGFEVLQVLVQDIGILDKAAKILSGKYVGKKNFYLELSDKGIELDFVLLAL
jgi:hypothetical protein